MAAFVLPPVARELREASECPMYRLSRLHAFCDDCSVDPKQVWQNSSCGFCRPLFEIPESELMQTSAKQRMCKLNEMHATYLEGRHEMLDSKTIGEL